MKLLNMGNAKEPTEMDMVLENISQTEEELQQALFRLGQMYFEDHKNDESSEERYYEMIDQINKLDQNRKGFYKNKLRLEGKMLCENCGCVIPYGSIFCGNCGKKADEKLVDEGTMKCAKCGAELERGSRFCVACGTKI